MVSQRQWIRQQMLPEGPTGWRHLGGLKFLCMPHLNLHSTGEIELVGGLTELGGAVVEGNVYIDGNPV